MTFLARVGGGGWQPIGTDDNAPYRVFHDVADLVPGTRVQYQAVVLDNAGHTRSSAARAGTVAPPAIELEAPTDGGRVRGEVEVRAVATPDHPTYVGDLLPPGRRRGLDADRHRLPPRRSTPPSTTPAGSADGSSVRYKAVLTYAPTARSWRAPPVALPWSPSR